MKSKTIEDFINKTVKDPYVIVKKYGYEYYLVEVENRGGIIPQPCFMGLHNMALAKCKKIKKEKK